MKKIKSFRINNEAVTSVIALVLVMMIFFSVTGAIFVWAPGYIENEEERAQSKAASKDLANADSSIDSLGMEGDQSYADFSIGGTGSVVIDTKGERFIPYWSYADDFNYVISDINDEQLTIEMLDGTIDKVIISYLDDTCFLAGTKVAMADGTHKNIEDIKVGEEVKAFDEQTGNIVISKVSDVFHYQAEEMPDYYLVINDDLKVTPNHRFYSNNEWVLADDLEIGDYLFTGNGDYLINSIGKIYNKVPVFDLEIELTHNYFVSIKDVDILVHNANVNNRIVYVDDDSSIDEMHYVLRNGDAFRHIHPNDPLGWGLWSFKGTPWFYGTDGDGNLGTCADYCGLAWPPSSGNYELLWSQWLGYELDKHITCGGFKVLAKRHTEHHELLAVDIDLAGTGTDPVSPVIFHNPYNADTTGYDHLNDGYVVGEWPWSSPASPNDYIEYTYNSARHEDCGKIGVLVALAADADPQSFGVLGSWRNAHLNELKLKWLAPCAMTGIDLTLGVPSDWVGVTGGNIRAHQPHPDNPGGGGDQVWIYATYDAARLLPHAPSDITKTSVKVYGKINDASHEDGCNYGFRWGYSPTSTDGSYWFSGSDVPKGDGYGGVLVGQYEHTFNNLHSGDLHYIWAAAKNHYSGYPGIGENDPLLEDSLLNWPYGKAIVFTLPEKPVGFGNTDPSTDSVTFRWDDPGAYDYVTKYMKILLVGAGDPPVGPEDPAGHIIEVCNISVTGPPPVTSYMYEGLDPDTTYSAYAWIWAEEQAYRDINGDGDIADGSIETDGFTVGAWSDISDPATTGPFTTQSENNPPHVPSNPDPVNEETEVGTGHDLSWTGGDPNGDAVVYDVYFEADDATPDVLVFDDQSGTTCDPGSMIPDKTYYWQIIAKDVPGDLTTSGPVWSFTTASGPDEIPPGVLVTNPLLGQQNVDIDQDIVITFDEDLDTTVDPTLTQTAGTDPGGWTLTWDSSTVARWTHASWSYGESITMKVTGYQDPTGNIGADYPWDFDVETSGGGNIAPNQPSVIVGDADYDEDAVIQYYTWSADNPITYRFSAKATDGNDDMIEYLFDWGDDDTQWAGPYKPGEFGSATHEWEESGIYIIRVKAKDIKINPNNALESDWSAPFIINVNSPFVTPSSPHLTKIEQIITNDAEINPWTIVATDGLTGDVFINLFSNEYPPDPIRSTPENDNPAANRAAVGCIRILDSGSISQIFGDYTTMLVGSNILSGSSSNMYIVSSTDLNPNSKSMIIEKEDGLKFDMSLIRGSSSVSSMSSGGTCKIEFEAKNIQLVEQPSAISRFKLLIVGDYKDSWYTYLTKLSQASFNQVGDSLVYVGDSKSETTAKQLVFSTSVVHAKIGTVT